MPGQKANACGMPRAPVRARARCYRPGEGRRRRAPLNPPPRVEDPQGCCHIEGYGTSITRFFVLPVGGHLDEAAMREAVDASLYRNRS
jgi:hypothetical protein